MYRIKKVICCVIVLAILGSMPVNAKEVLQNENEAWSPLQRLPACTKGTHFQGFFYAYRN